MVVQSAQQEQTSAVLVLPVADRLSAAAGHPSAVGCSPVVASGFA
jgi:hypothetical protein